MVSSYRDYRQLVVIGAIIVFSLVLLWGMSQPLTLTNPVVILTGLIFATILMISENHRYGVLLLVATAWLGEAYLPFSGVISPNRVIGAVLLFSVLMAHVLRVPNTPPLIITRFDYAAWALLFFAAASIMYNGQSAGSERIASSMRLLTTIVVSYVIYFLMVNIIRDMKTLRQVLWVTVFSGLLLAASLMQEAFSSEFSFSRFEGVASNPNMVGSLSILTILFIYWLVDDFPRGKKLLWYCTFPFLMTTAILTGSRTAVILLTSSAFFIVLLLPQRFGNRAYISILLILFFVFSYTYVERNAPQTIQESFGEIVPELQNSINIVQSNSNTNTATIMSKEEFRQAPRAQLILISLKLFARSPIFGIGLGNYGTNFLTYVDYREGVDHNVFTATLAQMGLGGFLALISMVYIPIRALWKAKSQTLNLRQKRIAVIALSTAISYNVIFVSTTGALIQREMFIICAITAIIARLIDENTKEMSQTTTNTSSPTAR